MPLKFAILYIVYSHIFHADQDCLDCLMKNYVAIFKCIGDDQTMANANACQKASGCKCTGMYCKPFSPIQVCLGLF